MNITKLDTIIKYKDKHTVVKAILYLKLIENDLVLPNNMLNVLSVFSYIQNKKLAITESLEKGFVKSWQSGENFISKLLYLKLLSKTGVNREISKSLIPKIDAPFIAGDFKIHNVNAAN